MFVTFDLYGRKSLETRFIFYLTALVLMMMIFCSSIVMSESYRQFVDDAARIAAQAAERVALGEHGHGTISSTPVDPRVISVIERFPDGGRKLVVGKDIPTVLPDPRGSAPLEVNLTCILEKPDLSKAGGGIRERTCWGFLQRTRGREFLVLVDSSRSVAQLWSQGLAFIWITALMLVVFFFLAMVMARNVLRPIRQFVEAIHKVTEGKFGFELKVAEQDEFGHAKATFNYMLSQLKEKELMERQLLHSQHLATVGRLAASVAHEIRNPLASINSLTQIIAQDPKGSPKSQEYAGVILREITRMDTSIQQLLNFVRPMPTRFREDRLSRVLEAVVGLMRHEARSRKVELDLVNRWEREFPFLIDAARLQQVFINLVKNAMEAVGAGGKISLSLDYDPDADKALVTVEDNGPGIPEDQVGQMFDPFFSTKPGGSGLGLAIVSKIVAQHSGQLRVDTELRNGTRFTLSFPRLAPETVARLEGIA